jgi:hypothetical protein
MRIKDDNENIYEIKEEEINEDIEELLKEFNVELEVIIIIYKENNKNKEKTQKELIILLGEEEDYEVKEKEVLESPLPESDKIEFLQNIFELDREIINFIYEDNEKNYEKTFEIILDIKTHTKKGDKKENTKIKEKNGKKQKK